MELWYSVVIGTVVYFYVLLFNRNARMYLDSGRTQPFDIENALGIVQNQKMQHDTQYHMHS
jgi:hypothetical protein